jgi:hypothetical protein
LAVLTAWQCWLLVGLIGSAAILCRIRTGRGSWVPMVAGATVGALLVIAWQLWTFASLSNLQHQLLQRTDAEGPPLALSDALRFQWHAIQDLVPAYIRVMAGAGLVIGMIRPQTRLCVFLMTASVVVYTVGLKGGAFYHDYWSYWVVTLLGLGCGIAASEIIGWTTRGAALPWWAALSLGGLAAVLAVGPKTHTSDAGSLIERGGKVGHLVATSIPNDQRKAWCVGGMCSIAPWVEIEAGLSLEWIQSVQELRAVAEARPNDIIVMGGQLPSWSNQVGQGQPFVVRARETRDR